jgi:hypothetical protein
VQAMRGGKGLRRRPGRVSPGREATMPQRREHSWTSAAEIVDGSSYDLSPIGSRMRHVRAGARTLGGLGQTS